MKAICSSDGVMAHPVAERSRNCIANIKSIVSTLAIAGNEKHISSAQAQEQLDRLSLWAGNIGALHPPTSLLSVEARLREADEVLQHTSELLDDLSEASDALLEIVTGLREGEIAMPSEDDEVNMSEERALMEEVEACISRLFRVSGLIRQAAPSDPFEKALSRSRYHFNDQYDIAHVLEKFPKLAALENKWLQKRLGRAITQRRQYLSYIQDHRDKLEDVPTQVAVSNSQIDLGKRMSSEKFLTETLSRPSTYITKASTLIPAQIARSMLSTGIDSEPDDDARSYTTVTRSLDEMLDSAVTVKIPKLDDLRVGFGKDIECPFCFRFKRFKNDNAWRRHVFEDLRSYVCTFPECDSPLFSDINEWFKHEMQQHRVNFTCTICKDRSFPEGEAISARERYITHIQRQHPQLLEADGLELLLQVSQRPVEHIPVKDCPLCSDWESRVVKHANANSTADESIMEGTMVSVLPPVFKRHVAAHLEDLALFAIPMGTAIGDSAASNMAIEEDKSARSNGSALSSISFNSSRNSLYEDEKDERINADQQLDYYPDGSVDAPWPLQIGAQQAPPPSWLQRAVKKLEQKNPSCRFEATMRYTVFDENTPQVVKPDPIQNAASGSVPPSKKARFIPTILCADCPGRFYHSGPERTVGYFQTHLTDELHIRNLEDRLTSAGDINDGRSYRPKRDIELVLADPQPNPQPDLVFKPLQEHKIVIALRHWPTHEDILPAREALWLVSGLEYVATHETNPGPDQWYLGHKGDMNLRAFPRSVVVEKAEYLSREHPEDHEEKHDSPKGDETEEENHKWMTAAGVNTQKAFQARKDVLHGNDPSLQNEKFLKFFSGLSRPGKRKQPIQKHDTVSMSLENQEGYMGSHQKFADQAVIDSDTGSESNRPGPEHVPVPSVGSIESITRVSDNAVTKGEADLNVITDNLDKASDVVDCAICEVSLEHTPPAHMCQLSCGHIFHHSCLYRHFQEFDLKYCPVCRNTLKDGSRSRINHPDLGWADKSVISTVRPARLDGRRPRRHHELTSGYLDMTATTKSTMDGASYGGSSAITEASHTHANAERPKDYHSGSDLSLNNLRIDDIPSAKSIPASEEEDSTIRSNRGKITRRRSTVDFYDDTERFSKGPEPLNTGETEIPKRETEGNNPRFSWKVGEKLRGRLREKERSKGREKKPPPTHDSNQK